MSRLPAGAQSARRRLKNLVFWAPNCNFRLSGGRFATFCGVSFTKKTLLAFLLHTKKPKKSTPFLVFLVFFKTILVFFCLAPSAPDGWNKSPTFSPILRRFAPPSLLSPTFRRFAPPYPSFSSFPGWRRFAPPAKSPTSHLFPCHPCHPCHP